ncbi:hypothetical protein BV20DRAFT_1122671 [Pilatotrama ljubarskyi]|nr:hypothetical protein BV20DRAFT_1122671 [Pilatotrama ljubarskyi]
MRSGRRPVPAAAGSMQHRDEPCTSNLSLTLLLAPSAPKHSGAHIKRDDCVHPQCLGCASFVFIVENRACYEARDPHQLCDVCRHPWMSHSARRSREDGANAGMEKGGCVSTDCGGFFAAEIPWQVHSRCVCGAPWGMHEATNTPSRERPLGRHPVVLPATQPPIVALPLSSGSGPRTASTVPAASPAMAFAGPGPSVGGSTNDRRVASYRRHSARRSSTPARTQAPCSSSALPSNVATVRHPSSPLTATRPAAISSVNSFSAPTSGAHAAPQADAPSTGTGDASSGAETVAADISFCVAFFPFAVNGGSSTSRTAAPASPELKWSGDSLSLIQLTLRDAGLTFTVSFPGGTSSTTPIWSSFNDQVVAHCDIAGIKLASRPSLPAAPSTLAWQLLKPGASRTQRGIRVTTYEVHGNLTPTTFTIATLLSNPFGSAIPNHLGSDRFLLIAPRYASLRAPIGRFFGANGSGTAGHIASAQPSHPDQPHRCFPSRVWAAYLTGPSPACYTACYDPVPVPPTAPVLTAASTTAATGPLNVDDISDSSSDDDFPDVSELFFGRSAVASTSEAAAPQQPSTVVPGSRRGSALVEAIRASMGDVSGSTSTNPLFIRSRSNSLEDALAGRSPQRRRLNGPDTQAPPAVVAMTSYGRVPAADISSWKMQVSAVCRVRGTLPKASFTGPTVESVAAALVFFLKWRFDPATLSDDHGFSSALSAALPGTHCSLVPLSALLSEDREFRIGDAFGRGPEHAVLRAAVEKMASDDSLWTDAGIYKTLNFHSSSDGGLDQREVTLKAYGFLCYLHVVNLGVGPEPVSPFLLHAIFEGRSDILIDDAFIRDHDSDLFKVLQPWHDWAISGTPLPAELQRANTELSSLLIAADINTTSLQGRDLPALERQGVERTLACRILLRHPDPTAHPDFAAFKAGFCFQGPAPSGRAVPTIAVEFSGRIKGFLGSIYSRRITNVEDFIASHLVFESASDDEEERQFEALFRSRLEAYLRGVGHPVHDELDGNIVPPERAAAERTNATLRASLLLHMMTGSSLMPLGSAWILKFQFIHQARDINGSLEGLDSPPAPIKFQACFKTGKVTIDPPLQNLLLQEPDAERATLFEAWLHATLLHGDGFNQV